jgi:hypothetical protein
MFDRTPWRIPARAFLFGQKHNAWDVSGGSVSINK